MISRIPIVSCASASGYAFGFTTDSIVREGGSSNGTDDFCKKLEASMHQPNYQITPYQRV